ncbi:MAG: pectin acetylesterase-family hydrolase [Myxococcota bacterium]|nr:pectin acetylesterase-family hydrolase [Myxococcota bacterium]
MNARPRFLAILCVALSATACASSAVETPNNAVDDSGSPNGNPDAGAVGADGKPDTGSIVADGSAALHTDAGAVVADGSPALDTDAGTALADGSVDAADYTPAMPKAPNVPCVPDESAPVPANRCSPNPLSTNPPPCGTWVKVEPPGMVCGDGSQFKFFVNYSNTSNNVAVNFEPGGACWDYPSCSGAGGIRGAANPHGIPDNHMTQFQFLNLLRRNGDNPVQNYNMVFVSYCTGDIHTGNTVATYTGLDLDGGAGDAGDGGVQQLVFHHDGHKNTLAVIDWLHTTFPAIPKLLVTGCSAGGAGAIINYHFIRHNLGSSVQCGYLLDDSGPIFHSNGPSKPLEDKIRTSWNTDAIIDTLAGQIPTPIADLKNDFGLISDTIAREYPHDRLSVVAYRMDFNYSLYSYQRFYPGSTEAQIHGFFWQDLLSLMKDYDAQPNLAYYFPYWRSDNCSHCVSIPPIGNPPSEPLDLVKVIGQPWAGADIPQSMIDLKQFTTDLMDDTKPLKSYVQDVQSNEMFTPAVSASCMKGG